MKRTCTYDKSGISTLADNKPVVYRIQDRRGKDNFVGVAKRERVDEIAEHLGCVPGVMIRITQYDSLADAKAAEQRIINRVKPKYNQKDWLGRYRRVRREAGSREGQPPATEGAESPLDQPVTGSASPSAENCPICGRPPESHRGHICYEVPPHTSQSAHRRKLAEAIDAALPSGEEIIEIDKYGNVYKPRVDAIAAVLASQGCVDPEEVKDKIDYSDVWAAKVQRLEQQLAALREDLNITHQEIQRWRSTGDSE